MFRRGDTLLQTRGDRVTRWVHVALGATVAALAAVLLGLSVTGLDLLGANREPGPGFFPVMVTSVLLILGVALALIWLVGPGSHVKLSLEPAHLRRAGTVWLTLVVFAALIEPLGFLLAGEIFVVILVVFVERIRTWVLGITMLLLPPATYFLFSTLLEVELPGGSLWS